MTDITAVSRAGDMRAQMSYASNAAAQSASQSAAEHRFQSFLTSFKHADAPPASRPAPPHPSASIAQAGQNHAPPDGGVKGHFPTDRAMREHTAAPANKAPPAVSRGVAPPHVGEQAAAPRALVSRGSKAALRVSAPDTSSVVVASAPQPTVTQQVSARPLLSGMRSPESAGQEEAKEPSVGVGHSVAVPQATAISAQSAPEQDADGGPQRTEMAIGKEVEPVEAEIHMEGPVREETVAKTAVSETVHVPEPPEEPADVRAASDQARIETEKMTDGHQTTLTLDLQQVGKVSFDIVNKDNKTFVFVPLTQNIEHISPIIKEMLPDCEILAKPRQAPIAKDKNLAGHTGDTASGKEVVSKKQSFWTRVVNISV